MEKKCHRCDKLIDELEHCFAMIDLEDSEFNIYFCSLECFRKHYFPKFIERIFQKTETIMVE